MREFVKHIAISMREDDTWVLDEYRARNDKLGVSVWIANGIWFVYAEWSTQRRSYGGWEPEVKVRLSLLEKLYLWFACKRMRKLKRHAVHNRILETIIERRLGQ